MHKNLIHFALLIIAATAFTASAQNAVLKPSTISGDVVSVGDSKIVIKTVSGNIEAVLSDGTEYKRVSAEKPSLATAVPAKLSDIAMGDKLLVTGIMASDGKSLPARAVYLMSSRELAERRAKETAEWTTNGVSGKVTAIDAASGKVTVEVRGIASSTSVTVEPSANTIFKRYAPNSIKYSEAVAGSAADIQIGDMLRARGEKNADGTIFTAKEILTGAIRTVVGAVKSIDIAKNEVVIADIETQKDVTVSLATVSTMKKFPVDTAQRLASAQTAGIRPGAPGGGQNAAQRPQGGEPGAEGSQRGTPGGMQGRPAGGIDEMLERFPTISVADLTPGEMIAVSSTKGTEADRISAIKLLAGVEPFLRSAQQSAGGRRGASGAGTGFTIPGLDDSEF